MDMKKVSVIIPTYKRNVIFLERAIESLINQTYPNIEIVVVDDNYPTSNYRLEVESFMSKFKKNEQIIYCKNTDNLGGAISRNNGVSAASGEYVTFLDDDDEYLPNKVYNQINHMLLDDCDLSFTNLKIVNEAGKCVDYREYSDLKSFNNNYLLKYHLMKHLTGTPTFMFKREMFDKIGGFEDSAMGQEFYLMMKSIQMGLKVSYLNNTDVIAYRHSSGGISSGENKIIGENKLFDYKKKYFHLLSLREKMFIKFRHYAVLSYAYARNKEYFKSLISFVVMFCSSPFDFFIELQKKILIIYKKS